MKKKNVTNATNGSPARTLIYKSKCCAEQANKPPCERSMEDRKENKFSQSSLGTWRCSRCKQKCSVTVHKTKVEAKEAA